MLFFSKASVDFIFFKPIRSGMELRLIDLNALTLILLLLYFSYPYGVLVILLISIKVGTFSATYLGLWLIIVCLSTIIFSLLDFLVAFKVDSLTFNRPRGDGFLTLCKSIFYKLSSKLLSSRLREPVWIDSLLIL